MLHNENNISEGGKWPMTAKHLELIKCLQVNEEKISNVDAALLI